MLNKIEIGSEYHITEHIETIERCFKKKSLESLQIFIIVLQIFSDFENKYIKKLTVGNLFDKNIKY